MRIVLFIAATLAWCQWLETDKLYVYAGAVAATAGLRYLGVL